MGRIVMGTQMRVVKKMLITDMEISSVRVSIVDSFVMNYNSEYQISQYKFNRFLFKYLDRFSVKIIYSQ